MNAETLESRIDRLSADVALLVERQRRIDDLLTEMSPILKDVMKVATDRLADAEQAGYFRAGKAVMGAVDTVVRSHPDDIETLGEDLVRILDTMRAVTRPEVLAIAAEAAEVVQRRDEIAPLGVVGMVRASGDVEVQRGMAVMLELLRHVGRAAAQVSKAERPAPRAPVKPPPAGRTMHKGLEALAPKRQKEAPASCAAPSAPGKAVTSIDGVGFTADGFVAEPEKWTKELGLAIAAQAGVEMTDAHWALVDFARKEYLETKVSPNIRRLSVATGTNTKDIYTLFKKAPGRTIARIAGIPKPAGCL